MIRVLLADDQHLVRGALAALLSFEDDITVVGEVDRGDRVREAVAEHRPDVLLLDIEMPGRDGLAVAAELRAAGDPVRVVILTTFGRPGFLARAMEADVAGYVLKDARAEELATAIRRVAAGQRVIDPVLAAASRSVGDNPLTAREREVLRVAADGATIADVAGRLFLSEGTVRNYLSNAITKLGVRNRAEAVRLAETNGWL